MSGTRRGSARASGKRRTTTARHRRVMPGRMAGVTLVEVLLAMLLISIALVPAMEALRPAIQGAGRHAPETQLHYHLTAKLEEVLAEPFSRLENEALRLADPTLESLYSDATTAADRRLVFLARYDADNADGDDDFFTGTDAGLVWVRVEIDGTQLALESLTSLYE